MAYFASVSVTIGAVALAIAACNSLRPDRILRRYIFQTEGLRVVFEDKNSEIE